MNAITLAESKRLIYLEKIVEAGHQTFVEVGLAMAEIRDQGLYRADFKTFEAYCIGKWGWTKQHCYRLINSAEVAKSNPWVTNERQAREIAAVPPADRPTVLATVAASGEPVTAAAIKAASKPPAAPKAKPAPILDVIGRQIPQVLVPLWNRRQEVQDLLTKIGTVKGYLRGAQTEDDVLYAGTNFSSILAHLDQATAELKDSLPYVVCAACHGKQPENCNLCSHKGFISQFKWETVVSKEDREMILKQIK